MQQPKSSRHVHAARTRWRNAELRAQIERNAGVPDRVTLDDCRQLIDLDLRSAGGRLLRLEPRLGYVAWRAVDADTGDVLHCAALKELMRWIASGLPRMLGPRHYC